MFSWLSILSTGLKLFAKIAEVIKDRQLLSAGEDRQIAKSLAAIQVSLGLTAVVAEEVSAMTPEEIHDELEERGAFD